MNGIFKNLIVSDILLNSEDICNQFNKILIQSWTNEDWIDILNKIYENTRVGANMNFEDCIAFSAVYNFVTGILDLSYMHNEVRNAIKNTILGEAAAIGVKKIICNSDDDFATEMNKALKKRYNRNKSPVFKYLV